MAGIHYNHPGSERRHGPDRVRPLRPGECLLAIHAKCHRRRALLSALTARNVLWHIRVDAAAPGFEWLQGFCGVHCYA